MASRFENFDLGRIVAGLLKVKDPENFPTKLNVDEVQPVLDISRFLGAAPIVGGPSESAWSWSIEDSTTTIGGSSGGNVTPVIGEVGIIKRVAAMHVDFTVTTDGTTPFFSWWLLITANELTMSPVKYVPYLRNPAAGGPLNASWAMGGFRAANTALPADQGHAIGNWDGLLPPGTGMDLGFSASAALPANWAISTRALVVKGPVSAGVPPK